MATKEEHPIVSIELSEQNISNNKKPSHVDFSSKSRFTGIESKIKYKYNIGTHNNINSESSESPTESEHYNSYDVTKPGRAENLNHSEKSPLLTESLNYSARFDTSIVSVSFQVRLALFDIMYLFIQELSCDYQ